MRKEGDLTLDLEQKGVEGGNYEHIALSAAFVIAYAALGALGRDVFFNHNVDANQEDDIIGAVLPYIRVASCAFAIFVVVASSGLTWALSKVPLMFAPFCLWALTTVAWSAEPKDTLRGAFTLIAAWVAMPMVIHRIGLAQATRLLLLIVAWVCVASCALAVCVPSLGQHSATDLMQAAHAGRWRGIFSHKNGLGPWAAYGSTLLLFYGDLMRTHSPFRWSAWISAVLCLIFSGSATSMVLAGACAALYLGLLIFRHIPPRIALLGASVLLTLAVAGLYAASETALEWVGRDATLSGRSEIWKFAFGYISERPWTGYGYATLGGADFLEREKMIFLQSIPGPESGYITLALESGITGAILFFVPFLISIKNGVGWLNYVEFPDRRRLEAMIIILISTFVEAFTETGSLVATGYDGVLCFGAFFSMLTAPRSPDAFLRRNYQLARNW